MSHNDRKAVIERIGPDWILVRIVDPEPGKVDSFNIPRIQHPDVYPGQEGTARYVTTPSSGLWYFRPKEEDREDN